MGASCMRSGECIKACDYGVNPRFRLPWHASPWRRPRTSCRAAPPGRGEVPRSQPRCDGALAFATRYAKCWNGSARNRRRCPRPSRRRTSCFTPAAMCSRRRTSRLLALDIMDALGVTYQVMGGPSHCCGILQLGAGDVEMSGRMGSSTMEKLSHSKSGQVISWCPSCYVQFTETTLPTIERQRGSRPFEMTPFMRFLADRLAQLKPHLQRRVEMRVALHRHPGVAGVMEAAAEILRRSPALNSSI